MADKGAGSKKAPGKNSRTVRRGAIKDPQPPDVPQIPPKPPKGPKIPKTPPEDSE